ncbi:MAG TPA: hypothetical protein G4O00_04015 [Thermoflexia bacterium]|jgi:hypothetical protein|nr:hypothetical protein [Thermoflexia bacterium]
MFFLDYEAARQLMERRVQKHLQEVERANLLRQARAGQRSWLTYQASRALSGLGHALVVLGQRLQRYTVEPATPAGE